MSIETCMAILWKLGNESPSFARRRFQAGGERVVNNFHRGSCKFQKKYWERVTPPLQLAMFFSRHRCETSCKKNCLVQHGVYVFLIGSPTPRVLNIRTLGMKKMLIMARDYLHVQRGLLTGILLCHCCLKSGLLRSFHSSSDFNRNQHVWTVWLVYPINLYDLHMGEGVHFITDLRHVY